jgi:tRNA 2-(methylsulfanyl)-N6-isopentenyladenosine37 hydroxylase
MVNTLPLVNTLPIKYFTPVEWATGVLQEPVVLLCDHAYLERKAASNALELLNRWAEPTCPDAWVQTLSHVAQDETAHLYTVSRLITKRGGALPRSHKNHYANDLRGLVRVGKGKLDILDRLLVSALIEVRSCERFLVLAGASKDAELKHLYHSLFASEAGHYKTFLSLAETVMERDAVEARWDDLLEREAEIIQAQPKGARVHSGM